MDKSCLAMFWVHISQIDRNSHTQNSLPRTGDRWCFLTGSVTSTTLLSFIAVQTIASKGYHTIHNIDSVAIRIDFFHQPSKRCWPAMGQLNESFE